MRPAAALALVLACLACLPCESVAADAERPMNVVMILADDLGWSDTTLYGGTRLYRTPNVERLARSGMLFTRNYTTSPLCSPTRASILTGQSPARTGITTPACHLPQVVLNAQPRSRTNAGAKAATPQTATRLRTEQLTLAEVLRTAGYATGHFGKWHLGHPPYSPLEHGFETDIPHWPGPGPAGSYVAPWQFPDFDPDTPREHIEDRMAKEAVRFIEQHQDQPFYLNYWMFSVHAPFDAKRALIEQYRDRIDPQDPQRSPTYAAMIESMDDAVGTLLDTLDRLQLTRRTIVIFTSDNGGNMYNQVDGTTPTSNAPLRGGKATMYEGGIRVPLIIRWPDVVKPGSQTATLASSCDFYPTLLGMLGLPVPVEQRLDGISLAPVLRGETVGRKSVFCYFPHAPRVPDWLPPSAAVIQERWKLIRIFYGGEQPEGAEVRAHRWKLYDLQNDLGEKMDLSAQRPEVVQALDSLLARYLKEAEAVEPLPNEAFDPAKYNPAAEGRAVPKNTGRGKRPGLGKLVAGWRPSRDCKLAALNEGRGVLVTSTGRDPYIIRKLPQPLPAGRYTMEATCVAKSKGRGQWFWHEEGVTPAFFRDRSKMFPIRHDGQPHRLQVDFTAARPILAIRLDPGQGSGAVELSELVIKTADGEIAYRP